MRAFFRAHAAALALTCALVVLAALALAFQPRERPKQMLAPLHRSIEDGLVSRDGALKIDINHADAPLLMTLPGIGEALAARIVAHRETHGAFATVDQLSDVPGIGQAKLGAIREFIACEQEGRPPAA